LPIRNLESNELTDLTSVQNSLQVHGAFLSDKSRSYCFTITHQSHLVVCQ